MKISTSPNYIVGISPSKPSPVPPALDVRPLGGGVIRDVPYQFGLQNNQTLLMQDAAGSESEVGVQILRVLSKQIAGALPHAKLASGLVDSLWFSLDLRSQMITARSPGTTRLAKALISAGLAAEAATIVAGWFEVRGLGEAAAVVSFVVTHGDHATPGTVEISAADANAFAEGLAGVGDVAEVRDALLALGSHTNQG